jgi:hypothetical protein
MERVERVKAECLKLPRSLQLRLLDRDNLMRVVSDHSGPRSPVEITRLLDFR